MLFYNTGSEYLRLHQGSDTVAKHMQRAKQALNDRKAKRPRAFREFSIVFE